MNLAVKHYHWFWLSGLALLLVLLPFLTALGALGSYMGAIDWQLLRTDPYLRGVIWFSLWQALLSTLISVGLAVPLARALARRHFPGRDLYYKYLVRL